MLISMVVLRSGRVDLSLATLGNCPDVGPDMRPKLVEIRAPSRDITPELTVDIFKMHL